MNTKKQEIVKKISDYYKSDKIKSIVLFKDKGLKAQELKKIKSNLWNLGKAVKVKNTLFECFLKENKFSLYDTLTENNIAIFCEDPFKVIDSCKKNIRKEKLLSKISLESAFIDEKFFNKKDVKKLELFSSKSHLQIDQVMTLQFPTIVLVKILTLAAEKNEIK